MPLPPACPVCEKSKIDQGIYAPGTVCQKCLIGCTTVPAKLPDSPLAGVTSTGEKWKEVKPPQAVSPSILDEVAIERRKQIAKGFDAAHDDQHTKGELMQAAATYLNGDIQHYPRDWEDDEKVLSTLGRDKRQDFIKGLAFLVAELERQDRAGKAVRA
jgi:hypothetical protein